MMILRYMKIMVCSGLEVYPIFGQPTFHLCSPRQHVLIVLGAQHAASLMRNANKCSRDGLYQSGNRTQKHAQPNKLPVRLPVRLLAINSKQTSSIQHIDFNKLYNFNCNCIKYVHFDAVIHK